MEGVASATIKINRELGKLELGKIDREYIRDAELRAILASTELDINIFKPYIDRKLRLITSVVYSEHFKLKGRRRLEVFKLNFARNKIEVRRSNGSFQRNFSEKKVVLFDDFLMCDLFAATDHSGRSVVEHRAE